jgi:spoIIIJ-associated protein
MALTWSPVRMRASSEESAISQALAIVGASREEVSVEIVERSDKGVTVRVSPRTADTLDAPAAAEPAAGAAAETPAPVEEAEVEPDADDAPALEAAMAPEEPTLFDAAEIEEPGAEAGTPLEASTSSYAEASTSVASSIPEEVRERACAFAQEMLDRMGLDARASLANRPFSALEEGDPDAEARVYVAVEGSEVSILIGKHGATLQSFQYLLNLALNNRGVEPAAQGEDAVRVVVDAGGYRARRAEVLERMAEEAAARAKRDRRAIRMEAMPAHERRLVHMALKRDGTITTGSEGREPQRFVVVAPAGVSLDDRSDDRGFNSYNDRGGHNRGGSGGNRGGYNSRGGGRGGRR